MSSVEKDVQTVINTDYHGYAMYVLENRAIPSVIDGMKNVHRKLLYGMLNEYKGKKTKLCDAAGISKFNYHHGETSAQGAAVTLTAPYNNNVPLFEGHGNFGSRLIQEAAAARYIFISLGKDFYKYFSDFEVCDPNSDKDNPEPQTYLPTIPWVLVNGIEGIAVGFACKFLPHKPEDLARACMEYISGKKITPLIPSFPSFSGTVTEEIPGKYIISGIVSRVKRNTWEITEVPYGHDRESIFNQLSKMEDAGIISDFEDNCDKQGFRFTVKMDSVNDAKCAKDPLAFFKLQKSVTENYTTLDQFGKLKLFDSKEDIVKYFCDYRLAKIADKLSYDIIKLSSEIKWLHIKAAFVSDVASNKINLKDKKKAEWIPVLTEKYKGFNAKPEEVEKLLQIPVVDMTQDYIDNLENKIKDKNAELDNIRKLTPKKVFQDRLKELT